MPTCDSLCILEIDCACDLFIENHLYPKDNRLCGDSYLAKNISIQVYKALPLLILKDIESLQKNYRISASSLMISSDLDIDDMTNLDLTELHRLINKSGLSPVGTLHLKKLQKTYKPVVERLSSWEWFYLLNIILLDISIILCGVILGYVVINLRLLVPFLVKNANAYDLVSRRVDAIRDTNSTTGYPDTNMGTEVHTILTHVSNFGLIFTVAVIGIISLIILKIIMCSFVQCMEVRLRIYSKDHNVQFCILKIYGLQLNNLVLEGPRILKYKKIVERKCISHLKVKFSSIRLQINTINVILPDTYMLSPFKKHAMKKILETVHNVDICVLVNNVLFGYLEEKHSNIRRPKLSFGITLPMTNFYSVKGDDDSKNRSKSPSVGFTKPISITTQPIMAPSTAITNIHAKNHSDVHIPHTPKKSMPPNTK